MGILASAADIPHTSRFGLSRVNIEWILGRPFFINRIVNIALSKRYKMLPF